MSPKKSNAMAMAIYELIFETRSSEIGEREAPYDTDTEVE